LEKDKMENDFSKNGIAGFFCDMHRSCTKQVIGGVCGGLAEQTEIPVWVFRAAFLILVLSFGAGIFPYIILWMCVPLKINDLQPVGVVCA